MTDPTPISFSVPAEVKPPFEVRSHPTVPNATLITARRPGVWRSDDGAMQIVVLPADRTLPGAALDTARAACGAADEALADAADPETGGDHGSAAETLRTAARAADEAARVLREAADEHAARLRESRPG